MKPIKTTTIKWRETLLGIKNGDVMRMPAPEYGVPSSLRAIASKLKGEGLGAYKITIEGKRMCIKNVGYERV